MARTVLATDPAYLKAAFRDIGLSEVPGSRHSARVLALFAAAGHPEIDNDETAWCAAAVGGWLAETGYSNTGSLMARSYARYGRECALDAPIPRGAIMVWPRGAPPSGHVNICLEDDGEFLTCIGGNQSNANGGGVTISRERKQHAIAARLPIAQKVLAPKPKPKPKPAPEPIEPSNQDTPDEPEVETDTDTKKPTWLARRWKGVVGWITGSSAVGTTAALTDWKVVAILVGATLVVIVAVIVFMGASDVRAWVRKQVS